MSWIVVGLAATGAIAGAASAKKGTGGRERWKRAAIGAGIGATAGLGAGAIGIGQGAASGAASTGAGGMAAGSTPIGYAGTFTVPGVGNAVPGMTTAAGTSAPISMGGAAGGASKMGFLKGLMYNDPNGNQFMQAGKSQLTSGMMSSLLGGGGGQQQTAPADLEGFEPAPMQQGAMTSVPLGYARISPEEQAMLQQYFASRR